MTSRLPAENDFPKLEKYELLEEIGHGGMATVYRSRDLRLDRAVAVKVIHRHLRENQEVAARFIAEARAAAKLKHRGIVEVYDVSGEDEKDRFLVAELVNGMTLRKLLSEHSNLPPEVGAAIVAELCDALEHAHAAGIIHRDIKPENVLFSLTPREAPAPTPKSDSLPHDAEESTQPQAKDPGEVVAVRETDEASKSKPKSEVLISTVPVSRSLRPRDDHGVTLKITDFGIAKILDAQSMTSTGQVLGSPAHMAPEQIEGGEIDARTDVFALGVLLYECLVGHLPFDGKNPAQVLRRVLQGQYERAEAERPAVGGVLSSITDRALALSPADRLESPAVLAALLREELHQLGVEDGRSEIRSYFDDPDAFRSDRNPKLVARLVARAEAHRREGRPREAAIDFNRAHAMAPDDLTILKRMTSPPSPSRLRTKKGLAAVLGLAVAMGGAAYGLVRAARREGIIFSNPTADGQPDPSAVPRPRLKLKGLALRRAERLASASAVPSTKSPQSDREAPTSATAPITQRRVRFVVQPRGATLTVDGALVDLTSAKPVTFNLGPHQVTLTPAPGDKSCDPTPVTRTIQVTAPREHEPPDSVQSIGLSLSFRAAKVRLLGPAGGQAHCKTFTLAAGAPGEIPMSQPIWEGSCRFVLGGTPGASAFVTLKAGEDNVIAWPAGT